MTCAVCDALNLADDYTNMRFQGKTGNANGHRNSGTRENVYELQWVGTSTKSHSELRTQK